MNWRIFRGIPKTAYLMLPIMALAFYIAFIPHQGYPYLVHIDEWVHLANSQAMLQSGNAIFSSPFTEQLTASSIPGLEAGFHLFWGVFHQISGISWLAIYRYFPGVIFIITVLSVYVLAQRHGFGWEAALLTCLIPTTVGILGPGFLVPIALGLLFIPLSLFIAFNFQNWWSYLIIFIFTSFLLSIHAPSAIIVTIILFPYILLNLRSNFKHSLGITLAVLVPFLAPFPWIFDLLLPTAKSLLVQQPLPSYVDFPKIVQAYGYVPIAIGLLGTLLLALKGGKNSFGLILGLLALLVILMTFFTFHYGVSIIYERGLTFMMLMMSIIAGAGLAGVRSFSFPEKLPAWLQKPFLARYTGIFLCVVLVGVTLGIAIPDRQDIPYYHMIDDKDYQAFVWIDENLDENYDKVLLDPWKATAFTAITGRSIYTRIHAFPTPIDEEVYDFLEGGCQDTAFLRENGISVIYTEEECRNPDLTEVRENIYLLKTGA